MISIGLTRGERLSARGVVGLGIALGGLVGLVLPGLTAPPLAGSLLMLAAGAAWGIYSLRGKGAGDPLRVTAGNFARAGVLAVGVSLAALSHSKIDAAGIGYAIASGALTSGIGYAIWYAALRGLKVTTAAAVQLSVPVIAAAGGVLLLDEPMTLRLALAAIPILGGIAIVLVPASAR